MKVCWSANCTRTFHRREPGTKTRWIMSLTYKFWSKALHLVAGRRHTLLSHRAPGSRGASQASGCPAVGTCVVLLPDAASRLAALTLIFAPVSHIPINSGFHWNCLSDKTTSRRWHEQARSTNKWPSISYRTRQARIKFVIPKMTYGSESHFPITLKQWIKSSTNCKNSAFL